MEKLNRIAVAKQACEILDNDDLSHVHDVAFSALWHSLKGDEQEQLGQLLFQGPVWDGNVISKAARGTLFDLGLATRCCFLGEQGYTAATYRAYSLWTSSGAEPFEKKPGRPG